METKVRGLGLRHLGSKIWNRWSRPGTGVDALGAGLINCVVTLLSSLCSARQITTDTAATR